MDKPSIHCGYHKAGWGWWTRTLRIFAEQKGLVFNELMLAEVDHRGRMWWQQDAADFPRGYLNRIAMSADIHVCAGATAVDTDRFQVTQMIRDPRDVVVSGYFYHLWCSEKWCDVYCPGMMTYAQTLNLMTPEDGINHEIETVGRSVVETMLAFEHYDDPNCLCMRYEDVIHDGPFWFDQAFQHYGYDPVDTAIGLKIAYEQNFKSVTGRELGDEKPTTHCRQGLPGDWRRHFTPSNKETFKRVLGDAVVKLGYEENNAW